MECYKCEKCFYVVKLMSQHKERSELWHCSIYREIVRGDENCNEFKDRVLPYSFNGTFYPQEPKKPKKKIVDTGQIELELF